MVARDRDYRSEEVSDKVGSATGRFSSVVPVYFPDGSFSVIARSRLLHVTYRSMETYHISAVVEGDSSHFVPQRCKTTEMYNPQTKLKVYIHQAYDIDEALIVMEREGNIEGCYTRTRTGLGASEPTDLDTLLTVFNQFETMANEIQEELGVGSLHAEGPSREAKMKRD